MLTLVVNEGSTIVIKVTSANSGLQLKNTGHGLKQSPRASRCSWPPVRPTCTGSARSARKARDTSRTEPRGSHQSTDAPKDRVQDRRTRCMHHAGTVEGTPSRPAGVLAAGRMASGRSRCWPPTFAGVLTARGGRSGEAPRSVRTRCFEVLGAEP